MGYNHMARVTSWNPAQRFGLNRKGDIAEGFDADLALVDPAKTWTIRAAESPSTQGYTPFEGLELSARVRADLPARHEDLRRRPGDRQAARAVPAPADGVSRSAIDVPRATARRARRRCAVAIVGAGACGLTAATALREAGVDCVLLERDAAPAGSTALSSGFIPAARHARAARGRRDDDSAEAFAADIQAKAHGRRRRTWCAAYTAGHRAGARTRCARHGVEFELLDGFLYPGHHARRMHALPRAHRRGADGRAAARGRRAGRRC